MQPHSTTADPDGSLRALVCPNGKPRPTITTGLAISYGRRSRDGQREPEEQCKFNAKSAKRLSQQLGRPITVAVYLKDSGSGLDNDRADYQELLRLAHTGQYEWILLYMANRLARDDREFITVVRELLTMGVRLWDYNKGEITTKNVNKLGSDAYNESREIATRTQDGLDILAAAGVKMGAPPRGYVHKPAPGMDKDGKYHRYGYTDDGKPDQYDHHPVIGPAITNLFAEVAAGELLSTAQGHFNARTGLHLNTLAIKRILRNEYYMGLTVGCKTRQSHPILDGHYARDEDDWQYARHDKPLTDEPTFKQVQARLDAQAAAQPHHAAHHRAAPSRYALTGLVWCATCNARMWGHPGNHNWADYRCNVCNKGKGTKMVERAVAAVLADATINIKETMREMAARMSTRRSEMGAELERAKAQLETTQENRTRWALMWNNKQIDEEQYRRGVTRYDREKNELERKIGELEHTLATTPAHAELAALDIERLPDDISLHAALMLWPVERTQELYKMCVKRVVIDADTNRVRVEYVDHFQPLCGEAVEVTMSRRRR